MEGEGKQGSGGWEGRGWEMLGLQIGSGGLIYRRSMATWSVRMSAVRRRKQQKGRGRKEDGPSYPDGLLFFFSSCSNPFGGKEEEGFKTDLESLKFFETRLSTNNPNILITIDFSLIKINKRWGRL
jgi:hypothetical protein